MRILKSFDKKLLVFLLVLVLLSLLTLGYFCGDRVDHDTLFQISVLSSLMQGVYDGDMTIAELKNKGNFGIGTFNALDGEMICLDGRFYQVKSDSMVIPVDNRVKTPFAMVTFFGSDKGVILEKAYDYEGLSKFIDSIIPSKNLLYAVKISGRFDYIKVRSVPAQRKPYPSLVEAVKNQSVFEAHNITGTLVGFRMPQYSQGINVAGYHLHFISFDRKFAGHLLQCNTSSAKIEIDDIDQIRVRLPKDRDFLEKDLLGNQDKEINAVEKGN